MAYWLVKSEPSVFSIEDLRRAGTTVWDGIRNYEARNNLRKMKSGDRALFYHSNTRSSAIVGTVKIEREAVPEPGQDEPRWFQVDLKFERAFEKPLALEDAKRLPELKGMALIKRGRLSVQPVTPSEWAAVLSRCG